MRPGRLVTGEGGIQYTDARAATHSDATRIYDGASKLTYLCGRVHSVRTFLLALNRPEIRTRLVDWPLTLMVKINLERF